MKNNVHRLTFYSDKPAQILNNAIADADNMKTVVVIGLDEDNKPIIYSSTDDGLAISAKAVVLQDLATAFIHGNISMKK